MRSPAEMETIALSYEDLAGFRSSPLRLWRLRPPIRIHDDVPPAAARLLLESRLNELAGVCGCAEGSMAGAVAVIAIAAYWIGSDFAFTAPRLTAALAVVIAVALLAKFARVVVARLQMRRVLEACAGPARTFSHMNAEPQP